MAMDHPKISIITTVYKTGHYLPLTVQSILAQTFTDFELLPASVFSTRRTAALPAPATWDWTTPAATTSALSIPTI